jgi:pimeloyl-ACP methyl ester carboxylesterase
MKILEQTEFIEPSSTSVSDDEPLTIHTRRKNDNKVLAIFVHGLGGKRYGKKSTWGNFPKYLFNDINTLDVALFQYRTLFGRLNIKKSIPIEKEAKIFAEIIRDELSGYQSIILLGHSMGGLLCKAAIYQLIQNNDQYTLSRIAGLFLLATPQLGSSKVPKFFSRFSSDFRVLKLHNKYINQVNSILEDNLLTNVVHDKSLKIVIPTWAILAGRDFWVDELSAGTGINSAQKKTVRGTHTEIVKPKDKKQDGMYIWVLDNIKKCAKKYEYDVFIAAPMAGYQNNEEYKNNRVEILEIITHLKEKCNFNNIYYAGQNLKSADEFEAKPISLEMDVHVLKNSRYFMLVYPKEIVSSVLFEAGMALAFGIPSIYFVKNRKNLPFIMEQAGQANCNPGVRIYECNDNNRILTYIDSHNNDLWKSSH